MNLSWVSNHMQPLLSRPGIAVGQSQPPKSSALATFPAITDHVQFGNQGIVDHEKALAWKQKGNDAHYARDYNGAIKAYEKALSYDDTFVDAWFNLGHTYINTGQFKSAATAFYTLLAHSPHDNEARIKLVEQLFRLGQDNVAIAHLDDLQHKHPEFDPARRLNGYHRLQYWAKKYGKPTQPIINTLGSHTLTQAAQLLNQYGAYRRRIGKPLSININQLPTLAQTEFYPTTQVDYVPNLAEYHHRKTPQRSSIRFSPPMAFAHPAVLAAYWLHESIHAKDNDPLTSITEEQDAYREKVQFWQWFTSQPGHPAVSDPNLDYATHLFIQAPQLLDKKVALHYRTRNPNIPKQSPNHPPKPSFVSTPPPVSPSLP